LQKCCLLSLRDTNYSHFLFSNIFKLIFYLINKMIRCCQLKVICERKSINVVNYWNYFFRLHSFFFSLFISIFSCLAFIVKIDSIIWSFCLCHVFTKTVYLIRARKLNQRCVKETPSQDLASEKTHKIKISCYIE